MFASWTLRTEWRAAPAAERICVTVIPSAMLALHRFNAIILGAPTRERRRAEGSERHTAADFITVDDTTEFQGHWHRISDRYLPRHVIAIDTTVENLRRLSIGFGCPQVRRDLSLVKGLIGARPMALPLRGSSFPSAVIQIPNKA